MKAKAQEQKWYQLNIGSIIFSTTLSASISFIFENREMIFDYILGYDIKVADWQSTPLYIILQI